MKGFHLNLSDMMVLEICFRDLHTIGKVTLTEIQQVKS
jgi:hypothetical protein